MSTKNLYPIILDYLSLSEYLQEFYSINKANKPWFSYRYWAKQIDMDAGYLVKVLQGKLKLPEKHLEGLSKSLQLSSEESNYLQRLLRFEKAKTPEQTRKCFEELLALRSVPEKTLNQDSYAYFSKWYHVAIRSLLEILDQASLAHLVTPQQIASLLSPQISTAQAKDSLALLERLQLIQQKKNGGYEICDKIVSTQEIWSGLAIQNFQEETLKLAYESLARHKKEDRDISTITFTLKKSQMDELKIMMKEFRSMLLKWVAENQGEDSVYQFNMQLFPLVLPGTLTQIQREKS